MCEFGFSFTTTSLLFGVSSTLQLLCAFSALFSGRDLSRQSLLIVFINKNTRIFLPDENLNILTLLSPSCSTTHIFLGRFLSWCCHFHVWRCTHFSASLSRLTSYYVSFFHSLYSLNLTTNSLCNCIFGKIIVRLSRKLDLETNIEISKNWLSSSMAQNSEDSIFHRLNSTSKLYHFDYF